MLRNYLRMAYRHLKSNPLYTGLNLVGLTAGLTCALLIALFVSHELSYDDFHENANRIVRVAKDEPAGPYLGTTKFALTPAPLTDALMAEIPEVEVAVQIEPVSRVMIRGTFQGDESGLFATAGFLDVFSFPLLEGNASSALSEPSSILLTESLARKYFGEDDPIGQPLEVIGWSDKTELRVTGVLQDPPANSHFSFGFVLSMDANSGHARNLARNEWDSSNYYTYAVLTPEADLEVFDSKLAALARAKLEGRDYYLENPDHVPTYFAQPLRDIHLTSRVNFELSENGTLETLGVFTAIGILILLLACINYMNLATARSISRSQEVGVRKFLGAGKEQLMGQFLSEALLLTLAAVLCAGYLARTLLPIFNELIGKDLALGSLSSTSPWIMLLVCGVVVGLIAGFYPAFRLSSLPALSTMRGVLGGVSARSRLRNGLVVFQFAIAIALAAGALVIERQLHFIQTSDRGLAREQIVSIPLRGAEAREQYTLIREQLLTVPGVLEVSASGNSPIRISSQSGVTGWQGSEDGQRIGVYNSAVSHNFTDLFGVEFVEGRGLREGAGSQVPGELLINETMRRELGWETAVGRPFEFQGMELVVVGVMQDFNFQSFRQPMAPLALYESARWVNQLQAKVSPEDIPGTLASMEAVLGRIVPDRPFVHNFLDDSYARMYESESRLGQLFGYFTALALIIACFGLFGLVALTASQRTKEMSVRKVLGASVAELLILLSKDSMRLVGVAFLFGAPLAYLGMSRWLEQFALRIDLGWGIFLFIGIGALILSWLTVSYQILRLARANPATMLRSE